MGLSREECTKKKWHRLESEDTSLSLAPYGAKVGMIHYLVGPKKLMKLTE